MTARLLLTGCILIFCCLKTWCQDDPSAFNINGRTSTVLLNRISQQSTRLEEKVNRQTQRFLQRLMKCETKLKRRLQKTDSTLAENLFNNTSQQYEKLNTMINGPADQVTKLSGEYLPNIDSLKTSLQFLEQNSGVLNASKQAQEKIQSTNGQVNSVLSKMQQTEKIKQFIRQRQLYMKQELSNYNNLPKSVFKDFDNYREEFYYYSRQMNEYKEILNDPGKLQKKALEQLNKLPAFKQFMKKHSVLAGMFNIPDDYGSPENLAGLQTKEQVQQLLHDRFAAGGPNAQQVFTQNLHAAQGHLEKVKDRIRQFGSSGGEIDMPDFKPKTQRTKSFLKRLEMGANIQSTKADYFFPTTTDVGLSLGYKLNDKSIVGIGSSFKVGWGRDIRHIIVSGQGLSLRSFIDTKLKGSIYLSGGWEYNYQQPVPSDGTFDMSGASPWQQSGLAGLSKIISLKSKTFKKTKAQLLWDFLSYQQTPRTQPLKFRIGYNF